MVEDIGAVIDHGQTIVIGNNDPDFHSVLQRLRHHQCVVDFVRVTNPRSENGQYDGICW